ETPTHSRISEGMSDTKGLRWERRPEERPQEILDAAVRVMSQCGYRGTRLEEVAEAAGISKATLYHYFKSKDELLAEAALQPTRATLAAVEDAARQPGAPASVRLRLMLQRMWSHQRAPEILQGMRLVWGELAQDAPALFQLFVREVLLPRWALIEGLIEEGQAAGEFRLDVDAQVAARAMTSALTLQAALFAQGEIQEVDPLPMDRIVDSTVDLLLHSVQARRGAGGAT
ncbi:MAG TPA: TetR/AcrR family transcriptional regulator, partial [Longimicrobiaceae bacterium]|nr:TetR/AcrR family transcriptional regulator [Longimicrobiaceae bacterium]